MNVSSEMESSGLGLRHYLDVVRRRKWIVLGVLVVAVAVAAGVSARQKPIYQARTKIVVGQGNSLFQPGVAYAVQPFTSTMGNLVASNVVMQDVIDNLHLGETPQSLLKEVTVSVNPTTAVIDVAVQDQSKQRAIEIAKEIGTVFSNLVKARFGALPTAPATPGVAAPQPLTATIFDPAHADPNPVSPKPKRNIALAIVLGLALGLLAAFLRDHFDRKLRTREAVEEHFGVPVIGQIPFVRRRKGGTTVGEMWETGGQVGEAFRALRANLQYLGVAHPLRTILMTSASPKQGKTTVTAHLAVAIASSGASVVAVEGDLRRPELANSLGVRGSAGLTNVLVGSGDLQTSLVDVPLDPDARSSGIVSLLPSGPLPPNPSELLGSLQMRELLDRIASLYDYVLIDSPPLLLVADTLELARMVDGVVFVARRNQVTSEEAREVRATVNRLGLKLLGVVMTDAEPLASYYHGYEAAQEPDGEPPAPTPPPPRDPAPAESLVGDGL